MVNLKVEVELDREDLVRIICKSIDVYHHKNFDWFMENCKLDFLSSDEKGSPFLNNEIRSWLKTYGVRGTPSCYQGEYWCNLTGCQIEQVEDLIDRGYF
jgi:hypothetical protein